jgi:hypothetical protein
VLEVGAKPLWVCRQTGTSLEMIEKHYGKATVVADELDSLIGEATERASQRRNTALQKRNLPGTFGIDRDDAVDSLRKTPDIIGGSSKAGDRGRTGDVQLGKLAFYR